MDNKKTPTKTLVIRTIVIFLIAFAVACAVYVIYVFVSYQRVDNFKDIYALKARTDSNKNYLKLEPGSQYSAISYNIGFGSYLPDFNYHADGGKDVIAKSSDTVKENVSNIADLLNKENADFVNLQEVDSEASRSHGNDEVKQLLEEMPTYVNHKVVFQESPFIVTPFFPPTGIIKSNMTGYSKFTPTKIMRFQLPVESGLGKFFDADRCYSKAEYKVENGKSLYVYNTHISKNLDDTGLPNSQIEALIKDMQESSKNGHYIICMADFNKQLVDAPEKYFPINKVMDERLFPSDFLNGTNIRLVAPFDPAKPVASVREATDHAYDEANAVANVDGFLVSSNIEVISSSVIDTDFKYSNHNPVKLTFKLNKRD